MDTGVGVPQYAHSTAILAGHLQARAFGWKHSVARKRSKYRLPCAQRRCVRPTNVVGVTYKVFRRSLPVGLNHHFAGGAYKFQATRVLEDGFQVPGCITQIIDERGSFCIKTAIDKAMKAFDAGDFFQAQAFLFDRIAVQLFFKGNALQFAVGAKAPAVVTAHKAFRISGFSVN
ncbi:hypothetical protein SDC9_128141 [bioreactor metagenome]|uniref:Uncharacterized protein n=1 Tax=bioreactor metagenome TaxID=1076179 RepID=A0A645CW06_9ZZZZ